MVLTAETTAGGALVLYVLLPVLGALVFVAVAAWAVRIGTRPLLRELERLRSELQAQRR